MHLLARIFLLIAGLSFLPLPQFHAQASPRFHFMTVEERGHAAVASRLAAGNPPDARAWARQQSDVVTASLGPDGKTLEIDFRDGASVVIVPQTIRARGTQRRAVKVRQHLNSRATGDAGRALVLEPFAHQLGGSSAGAVEIKSLTDAGFKVDVLRDVDVTIPAVENLAAYSVVYMETHSGLLPNGDAIVLTGETDSSKYTSLFNDGSVAQGLAAGDTKHIYVAFRENLIRKHLGRFPDSSLVFINGCSILAAPTFLQSLLAQNAGAVLSWDDEADNLYAEAAADYIFPHLLTGATLADTMATTSAAGLSLSPSPNGIAHLGFRGDGNVTLAEALSAATPTATPTDTPTISPVPSTPTVTSTPTITPTAIPQKKFRLVIHGGLKVNHPGTLTITVRDRESGTVVRGAQVAVDGRKVSLKLVLRKMTDTHGLVIFKHVQAGKPGKLTVKAQKVGFEVAVLTVRVRR